MKLRPSRVILVLAGAALSGLVIFGILAAGVTTVSRPGRAGGPAALRGSGFDLDRLGLTPGDLARQGRGIILDETFAGGDRLLVWAE
jgi:hypothetical protein